MILRPARENGMGGYDVIGDVHGHADALERLLEALGYTKRNGVHRHPTRTVVFAGDFVDRGPQQRAVLSIARTMVTAGAAQARPDRRALRRQTLRPVVCFRQRLHAMETVDRYSARRSADRSPLDASLS